MTLVEARRRLFPRQVPPFKWVISVVSDVRANCGSVTMGVLFGYSMGPYL
jgi:hypothetical protein